MSHYYPYYGVDDEQLSEEYNSDNCYDDEVEETEETEEDTEEEAEEDTEEDTGESDDSDTATNPNSVVIQAQTGSGKTLTYLLPLFAMLEDRAAIQAMIFWPRFPRCPAGRKH